MKVLVDTCCFIWAVSSPRNLGKATSAVLKRDDTEPYVSVISCGEIACLAECGRLALGRHWRIWFNDNLKANAWQTLDITLPIIEEAFSLPEPFHADLADRVLVATARLHGLTILTADTKILSYPHVKAIWD